ncbi:MAG: alkaline shock response membrane anchor protein AmaP [Streptosporangiaceae bacterium]
MHAERTNRAMLLLTALILIATGLGAGAASLGVFGTSTQHSRLIANPVGHFIGASGAWLWPVAAAAAAILVVLALRWLLALLFSTDRAGDLPIASPDGTGRTTLAARALTDAVAEEVESYLGVDSARARLIGNGRDPELVVTAALQQTADLVAVRQRIETGALTHARSALGNQSLPIQLHLTVTTTRPGRVA